MSSFWHPQSWQSKTAWQLPDYTDSQNADQVVTTLASLPSLIGYKDVQACFQELAKVTRREAFILQAGDCAERFIPSSPRSPYHMLKLLDQLRRYLESALNKPIITIGRIAGQYAKPRTRNFERRGDITLPSYRGDMINDFAFTALAREADPRRMIQAYDCAQKTLAVIKKKMPYLFTAHEALMLPYESALTRFDEKDEIWYASSAHFPWVGNRTRQLDGAHIEWARGIANPIGVKCNSNLTPDDLCRLVEYLNPNNSPGRLTMITRFGVDKIVSDLPPLLECTKREGFEVVWCCDPMHGNTHLTQYGVKTRSYNDIAKECYLFIDLVKQHGLYPGGIHLEITGDSVTECLGGPTAIDEQNLQDRYETYCDPRLNPQQCLDLVQHIAHALNK